MFFSTPSNVAASAVTRVPTELFVTPQTSTTTSWYSTIEDRVGASLSSAVTSTTLTEVLYLPDAGVMTFAGIIASTATSANPSKLQIQIDGKIVTNESSMNIADDDFFGVVGSVYIQSSAFGATGGAVPFNSLRVFIAGDATNGVQFAYKYYLT